MVSKVYSMGINGIDSFVVKIESDVSKGMPTCDIVGLPDTSIKESRNRVRSAITNCGFTFPLARITVNLAPADVRKCGSQYDLPIFLSLLKASGQILYNLDESAFIGELSLSGEILPVSGVLSMTLGAKKEGFKNVFVPYENAKEAAIIPGIKVYALKHASELMRYFENNNLYFYPTIKLPEKTENSELDFSSIKGQQEAKYALEVAAAGGHNVLMTGPPGTGKSMMAKHLISILPDLTFEEMIETTSIYSIAGMLSKDTPLITQRPFRSPHHSTSTSGISGGGTWPRPGELSLAHNGILFLDELPEFSRASLEAIRQPLEDGCVTISRVKTSVTYPCSIMLITAMNPCPCGYYGHPTKKCTCTNHAREKYVSKISGPILDRIDIHIEVPPVNYSYLNSTEKLETSKLIRERVNTARAIQNERYKACSAYSNAKAPSKALIQSCYMTKTAKAALEEAYNYLALSVRGYEKLLRVARTVADLDGEITINYIHIEKAVNLRDINKILNLKVESSDTKIKSKSNK